LQARLAKSTDFEPQPAVTESRPTIRLSTPADLEALEAETGRDFSGPCTLIVERDGRRVGLLAVRDREDCIEVCRLEGDTPQIAIRLVEAFERLLVAAGLSRYRFTTDPGRMQTIAAKMVERGIFRELGQAGPHRFYERIIDHAP